MREAKFQGTAGYVTRMSGGVGGRGREASSYPDWASSQHIRAFKVRSEMNSQTRDITGWLLAATATLLAILGAMTWSNPAGKFFAGAVVTLVAIERRRSKTVTAALIRVTDEKGEVRGLVAWDGEGIQVGVRADSVNNSAVAYPILWQKNPSVAFTFKPAISMASGKVFEDRKSVV